MNQLLRLLLLTLCAWASQAGAVELTVPSADGKLQLPALWFEASGPGPHPVVIGLHGCGGARDDKSRWNPIWRRYASYFLAEGMSFLVVDSLTPRGQTTLCSTPDSRRTIHEEDRRDDAYAALTWLSARPDVDAKRMAVIGWSHGAQTVLSFVDAGDSWSRSHPLRPAAAVAFFPGCSRALKSPTYAVTVPTLVMIGEKDDWTLAANCTKLRDKLKAHDANSPFEVQTYPDAYHGFDGLTPVHVMQNIGNTRSGTATVGNNEPARIASHARLFEYLSAKLDVPLKLTNEARLKVKAADQNR